VKDKEENRKGKEEMSLMREGKEQEMKDSRG
jgi:hypothetical protein